MTPTPVPRVWRDPAAWLAAASVLLVLLKSAGAPLGVPAAEDFDFLRHARFGPGFSFFDGGGSLAFWRPLSQQVYYGLLGPLILEQPARVAALHAVALALATVLVYRTLRPAWSPAAALAAATFPLLAESCRALIAWPSHSADLGAYLFSAAALHEASRRRLGTALAALLAALLCKETAVVTAALLPFLPGVAGDRAPRARWLLGGGLVLVAWAAAYAWVRREAGLELPHALERDPAQIATPLAARLGWAFGGTLAAIFSQPRSGSVAAIPALIAGLGIAAAAAFRLARDRNARARAALARPWAVWGLAGFALGAAMLASIHPLWSPVRALPAGLGFGIGAVALARAAHPGCAAALVAVRLIAFALAPAAPATITPEPAANGATLDFVRITRVQRLMELSRRALGDLRLAPGAAVGFRNLPLATEYAFGGAHALQVWYADTTLRWVAAGAIEAGAAPRAVAVIEYQPRHEPQVVRVDPAALRWKAAAIDRIRAGDWTGALAALDRADSSQRDRRAAVLLGEIAGRRALALAGRGGLEAAEIEARRALAAAREDHDARYIVAFAELNRPRPSRAHLDTLLALAPDHAGARSLAAQLAARERRAPASTPARPAARF